MSRLSGLAGAILILASGVQAQATFITEVRVLVHDYENLREEYYQNDPNFKSLTHGVDGIGTATSTAQLGFGFNKVSASFNAFNADNPAERMMADARTFWNDMVVIDSPGLEGTLGTFTASLRVEGTADFHMDGIYASEDPYAQADLYGFWDAWIGTSTDGGGSYLVGGWFGSWYSDGTGGVWYEGDDLSQPMTEVTLEFIYGQPFLLGGNLEAYFDAENYDLLPGTVGGTLDFSHSAYWDGIGGFYNANGNPVGNISLSSQSGVNWIYPVPEPGTWVMLGVGAMALLRRPQRR